MNRRRWARRTEAKDGIRTFPPGAEMNRRRRARRAEAKDGVRNPHIFLHMLRFLRAGLPHTAFARYVFQHPVNQRE